MYTVLSLGLFSGTLCRHRGLPTEYWWAQQSLLRNEEEKRPVTEWEKVRWELEGRKICVCACAS